MFFAVINYTIIYKDLMMNLGHFHSVLLQQFTPREKKEKYLRVRMKRLHFPRVHDVVATLNQRQ